MDFHQSTQPASVQTLRRHIDLITLYKGWHGNHHGKVFNITLKIIGHGNNCSVFVAD